MKVVTCTGYFSTGSSAICDLLSEYKGFYFKSDYELRFIYDPDGLSDLEYHLIENHNRHNSGYAIKRYKKLINFYCGNCFAKKNEWYFNGKWKLLSEKYLQTLTEFSYNGAWLYDYLEHGIIFYYLNSILRKIFKSDLLSKEKTPCAFPSKKFFLETTRDYLSDLFISACNGEKCDVFIADQALPPSNIDRFVPMFENIFVFVVERDPRDVFFLEKYIRKENIIPTNVEDFCKWYEYTRRHRAIEKMNTKHCMLIQFEDLIYNYEKTKALIEHILNINNECHYKKMSKFNPQKSIINTQIWLRINMNQNQNSELEYIEENLTKYLYKFPKIVIENKNFDIM